MKTMRLVLALLVPVAIVSCSAVDPEPDPWSVASCKQACLRDYPEAGKEHDLCLFNCEP